MTLIGGKVGEGIGFFIVCVKCGWHSTVEVYAGEGEVVIFHCKKCGQEVEKWY